MPAEVAELLFSKPMNQLYQSLTAILLKDKNVFVDGEAASLNDQKQQRSIRMISSIVKVQTEIVNHGENQAHISHVLGDMAREIKDAIGISISPESESVLQQLAANFEIIDKNLTNLKERIDHLEQRL